MGGKVDLIMLVVGISACLLGEPVRYDGGHKKHAALLALAGKRVEYIPLCPEAGCGLGVPREPMQLVGDPDNPRLLTLESYRDETDKLNLWCQRQMPVLRQRNPSGFIFKNRSPSCGLTRVKVAASPDFVAQGGGIFARMVKSCFADLPLVEADDLVGSEDVERFLGQVAACAALQSEGSGVGRG
jgi:uncharacterized protein YbbK (DUF523 family)